MVTFIFIYNIENNVYVIRFTNHPLLFIRIYNVAVSYKKYRILVIFLICGEKKLLLGDK